jgi:hypothetical protein
MRTYASLCRYLQPIPSPSGHLEDAPDQIAAGALSFPRSIDTVALSARSQASRFILLRFTVKGTRAARAVVTLGLARW